MHTIPSPLPTSLICSISSASAAHPASPSWVGSLLGAVIGGTIGIFSTRQSFRRHDQGVRIQITSLVALAKQQLVAIGATTDPSNADDSLVAFDRLIERAFSNDVALALPKEKADVFYKSILNSETSARNTKQYLAELKSARDSLYAADLSGVAPNAQTLSAREIRIAERANDVKSEATKAVESLQTAKIL
jgi:hypothetical protein